MKKLNNELIAVSIVAVSVLIFAKKKRSRKMRMKKNDEVMREFNEAFEKTFQTVQSEPTVTKRGLSNAEITELTSRFKGMGEAELELFVDLLPVDICMKRIQKELDKAKEFEAAIKSAMSGLN